MITAQMEISLYQSFETSKKSEWYGESVWKSNVVDSPKRRFPILTHPFPTVKRVKFISELIIPSSRSSEKKNNTSMVVEIVPVKGGIGSIFHPPEGKDYR